MSSDRLTFAVVEHFVDSSYERSRLQRVDTELPARLNDGGHRADRQRRLRRRVRRDAGRRLERGVALPGRLARCKLEFELEDRQRLDLQGEMRWRRDASRPAVEAGIGMQFVEMREEQRMLVEEFVRQQQARRLQPAVQQAPSRAPSPALA